MRQQEDDRPYADKTDEELAAICGWLGRHLEDLERQRASIQAEQRRRCRDEMPAPELADIPAAPTRLPLAYFPTKPRLAGTVAEDKAYAADARRYAMRIAWIAVAIAVVVLVLLSLAALL